MGSGSLSRVSALAELAYGISNIGNVVVRLVVWGPTDEITGGDERGGWCARFKAVREMPRPYVGSILQAKVTVLVSKSIITEDHNSDQYPVTDIRTVTTQDQSQ